MTRPVLPLLILTVLGLPAAPAAGQFPSPAAAGRASIELLWHKNPPAAGSTASLGVLIEIEDRWHIQAGAGSGDEVEGYIASTIDLALPEGWTAGTVIWPKSREFSISLGGVTESIRGYAGTVMAVIPITIPSGAAPGPYPLRAELGYQACDDRSCDRPRSARGALPTTLRAPGQSATPPDARISALFEVTLGTGGGADSGGAADRTRSLASAGAALLLLAAALGGFLLNFTPCVLPVIPLKIMGLAQSAGNRRRTFILGVAMFLGVVAFWMGLGAAIVTISGFTAANQLFQHPPFAIGVGVFIAVLAVAMCGLFSIPLPRAVYAISPSHETCSGSFLFGVMTAVLSTPCTAPFMGAAAAAAVGQSAGTVLSVFAAIGSGMALPYLVLSAFPMLVRWMPRSGPASALIKQVMGLFMLAVAAFFIGLGLAGALVTPPDPPSRAYFWIVFAIAAAAAIWLMLRTLSITRSVWRRVPFLGAGAAVLGLCVYLPARLTSPGPIDWVYYTPQRLEQAMEENRIVVMEFTAEWCLNCKLLEKAVLNSDAVVERLADDDVVPIKVDLTGNNAAGNAKLRETGSVTIPWLVVFAPGGSQTFARNWYTAKMLLEGIDGAGAPMAARR